jgi:2-octaprenyl-3-methyl-6-methoxy-1,4-benzoquinol hydroxylase
MFDFCINGAGMVGAATALGLAKQGYRIALIEPSMPVAFAPAQPPDIRLSAINMTSVELLKDLGAWQYTQAMRIRPYNTLSVWEDAGAKTDFEAQDIGLQHLGYFVENRLLQLGAHEALKAYDNVEWFTQDPVSHFDILPLEHTLVTLSSGQQFTAKWLLGADGANSRVRQAAHIGVSGWQYQQQAMGILIKLKQPVADWTWQQFTPTGPRALLPMYDDFASLIWYDQGRRIKELMGATDHQLKDAVLSQFPPLLPEFEVVNKAAFTLVRRQASHYVKPGVILLGDAAHTINPLAGQGVNLGFKDVNALLEITAKSPNLTTMTAYSAFKRDYETPRMRDNGLMMSAMDGFYLLFSNQSKPLKVLRNTGLKMAQYAGPLKRQALKYAMGMNK